MNTSVFHDRQSTVSQTNRTLAVVIGVLVLLGFYRGESMELTVAYLLVLFAAVMPSVLWLRMGAPGIPVLPVVGLAYIPYIAWPVLSGLESTRDYMSSEIVRAALTVALFLVTATVVWRLIVGRERSQFALTPDYAGRSMIIRFVLVGLLLGVIFHAMIIFGWLGWMGSFLGLVRSIVVTFVTVACFLTGVTRAWGLLRGVAWRAAVVGIGSLIFLAWSSLFLMGGMVFLLALAFGYVLVARRIPWLAVGMVLVVVTVLHAGKAEMRGNYWELDSNSYSAAVSVIELPRLAAEWVGAGVSAIAAGDAGQSVLDRTSLLQMILLVQSNTPDHIDFLNGETYAMLPGILVPRFIDADKPVSQVGMNLLNVRYGVMIVADTEVTAIGWGLVAEAYANFGYLGVIGIALLLGAFCAVLKNWSANAKIVSIPTLISISAMLALINLEADFIHIFTTLFQSSVSVLIFYNMYKWFTIRQSSRANAGTGEFGRL